MSRPLILLLPVLLLAAFARIASGQEAGSLLSNSDPFSSSSSSSLDPPRKGSNRGAKLDEMLKSGEKSSKEQSDATEITSTKQANFDQKNRTAVFLGDVKVKNPQFTLTSDKLTAVMKMQTPASKGGAQPAATPPPEKKDEKMPEFGGGGGLEKVIAEGNVVIIHDRPAMNGAEAVHYAAKAGKAEYDAATGNMTLTEWPQVQQGINTQVATEASTVMILNRDGRMITSGGSKTLIQDSSQNTPKP